MQIPLLLPHAEIRRCGVLRFLGRGEELEVSAPMELAGFTMQGMLGIEGAKFKLDAAVR